MISKFNKGDKVYQVSHGDYTEGEIVGIDGFGYHYVLVCYNNHQEGSCDLRKFTNEDNRYRAKTKEEAKELAIMRFQKDIDGYQEIIQKIKNI